MRATKPYKKERSDYLDDVEDCMFREEIITYAQGKYCLKYILKFLKNILVDFKKIDI